MVTLGSKQVLARVATIGAAASLCMSVPLLSGSDAGQAVLEPGRSPDVTLDAGALERAARAALEPEVTLGKASSAAFDLSGASLPSSTTRSAESMYVLFGKDGGHTWKLYVEAEADRPSKHGCPDLRVSASFSCRETTTADGSTVVTSVVVAVKVPGDPWNGNYALAEAPVPPADDDSVRIERNVRAFGADGGMTSVTETVWAPTSLDPDRVFDSSVASLTRLAAGDDAGQHLAAYVGA